MSPRLQPRRSVKTVLNYYEDAQESEDDYESGTGRERSAQSPRRGKVKTERSGSEAKQARRRRSGKLSKFPAMPLDVMYEVGHLMLGWTPAYVFGHPDTLATSSSGFVKGILDIKIIS